MIKNNRERRNANICLLVMILGIALIAASFLLDPELVNGGVAFIFIGGIIAIIAFFTFLMFNNRAKVMERLFRDENILAHWRYSQDFWQNEIKEDLEDFAVGRIIALVIAGIFFLIGVAALLIDTDNAAFAIIMIGVGLFILAVALLALSIQKKRLLADAGEAIICNEGLYFKSVLHAWNQKTVSYLEAVAIHPLEPDRLLFVYRQLSGSAAKAVNYPRHTISVPVPLGEEHTAERIAAHFNMPLTQDILDNIEADRWQDQNEESKSF